VVNKHSTFLGARQPKCPTSARVCPCAGHLSLIVIEAAKPHFDILLNRNKKRSEKGTRQQRSARLTRKQTENKPRPAHSVICSPYLGTELLKSQCRTADEDPDIEPCEFPVEDDRRQAPARGSVNP